MEIEKSLILSNFQWVLAQQTMVDMLKILGLYEEMLDAYERLGTMDIMIIYSEYPEYPRKLDGKYSRIYELFWNLDAVSENKNTYLPNLCGLYLLNNLKN